MQSLSVVVAAESLSTLRERALLWGGEPPTSNDADARQRLERAMRDTVAARFVWERLSEDERKVLYAIIGPSARNWQPVDTLSERAKLPERNVKKALDSLARRHLILTEMAKVQGNDLVGQRNTFYGYAMPRNTTAPIEEKLIVYTPTELATSLYTTGRELFVPQADRSEKPLDDLLLPYRQRALAQIGRRFGFTVQAYYSRNEVRAAMAENLTQADAVRYALTKVEAHLRDAYEWLRRYRPAKTTTPPTGRAPAHALAQHFGLNDVELGALLRLFEEYALAFDTFSNGERIVFIPKETMANLRRADERPQGIVGLHERPAPRAIRPASPTLLWDVAALTASALHQGLDLTRSGSLPKRAALRLAASLTGERVHLGEAEALQYVEFLKQVACELGVVVAPGSTKRLRTRLGAGAKIESWGRHDLVMQARKLYRWWPTDRWSIDLPGAQYREWLSFYCEVSLAREQTQKLLSECKPGVWYSLASFRATILGDDPFVLRPAQRRAGDAGFKLAEDLRAQWEHTDGELIAGLFRSTLAELGLVELGYDRETIPGPREHVNPDAFLLTEFGYEVIQRELSASAQPSMRPLVVQPNFQALLMEPSMPMLYWLVRFASLDQIGQVSRFTFTREALHRGLRLGDAGAKGITSTSIDEVIAFLVEHSQKALPQNVEYTMRDWARQYRESTEGSTRVLTARSEELARAIVTSPVLRAFKLSSIGPRMVSVPPEISLSDLWRALENLGIAQEFGAWEDLALNTALSTRRRSRPRRSEG